MANHSPGLQQGAVHGKVLRGKQGRHFGLREYRGQELHRRVARQQPIIVLGECGRVPHRIIHAETNELAEQQVELDPLNQLEFRTDRVKDLQQQRTKQLFRRNRSTPERRVKRVKLRRQILQCRVHDAPECPQRVVPGTRFSRST